MGRIGGACAPVILATFLMGALALSWQTSLGVIAVPACCWRRPSGWWCAAARASIPGATRRNGCSSIRQVRPTRLPAKRPSTLAALDLPELAMMLVYAFTSTFQDQLYVNGFRCS